MVRDGGKGSVAGARGERARTNARERERTSKRACERKQKCEAGRSGSGRASLVCETGRDGSRRGESELRRRRPRAGENKRERTRANERASERAERKRGRRRNEVGRGKHGLGNGPRWFATAGKEASPAPEASGREQTRENESERASERASASKNAKQADRGRAGQVWFVKRAAMVRDAVKVNFAGAGRERARTNARERERASERASERNGRGEGGGTR